LNFKNGFGVLAERYILCTANRVGSLDYYLPRHIWVSRYGLLGFGIDLNGIKLFSVKAAECANYVPALPGRFE
jgi:hypothetical protein